MRTPLIISALSLALLVSPAASAHPHATGIDARQRIQDIRIHAGLRRGDLTQCEAARLHRRADRIAVREAHFRASRGLQLHERLRLRLALNDLSRDIYWQRHHGRGCW